MTAIRQYRILGLLVALGMTTGCLDTHAPTEPSRLASTIGLRLNIAISRAGAESRSLRVVARYARAASPTILRGMDSVTVPLSPGAASVPVRLNLSECLRDADRELPAGTSPNSGVCVLHVALTLLDDTMRMIDESALEAFTARAGEETIAPEVVLGQRPSAVDALTVGLAFSCALTEAGFAYCWGDNSAGQFGSGDTVSSSTPKLAAGGRRFTQISAQNVNVCGVALGGTVYCWGPGLVSQPAGATGPVRSPIAIDTSLRFRSVSVGGGFACGIIVSTDDAYCWGTNRAGVLGVGDTLSRGRPTLVVGGLKFRSLSAGLVAACGVSNAGQLHCWGSNSLRQINGTASPVFAPSPTPVPLPGNVAVASVGTGAAEVCALGTDTGLYCWGSDFYGTLARGVIGNPNTLPTRVGTSVALAGLAIGKENIIFAPACGWIANGAGHCWGANSKGQLGSSAAALQCTFGTTIFPCSAAPIPVAGSASFVAMATGGQHTCGLTTAHTVLCWGFNQNGQIGDGTLTDAAAPTLVNWNLRTP